MRTPAARADRGRSRRARGGGGLPVAEQPLQPDPRDPAGLLDDARRLGGRLVGHRPPHGARAGGLPRLPRDLGGGRPARPARRAAAGPHGRLPAGRMAGRSVLHRLRRHRPRGAGHRARDRRAGRRRGGRRDPRLPAGRLRTADRGDAGRGRPAALRAGRPPMDRLGPRCGRRARGGVRVGLGRAPADPGRAEARGRQGPSRRHPDGGDALARSQRPRGRGCGGGPRAAAGDDGRRDRGAGRHALRPRRAGPEGRGDDRAARQRGGAVLHAAGAGLLPPGPDLAADARPHPLPALGPRLDLVPRGRSGPPPAAGAVGLRVLGSCRRTRRRWARSAPTSRAGRSTRSG